jgi:hypothetical protein
MIKYEKTIQKIREDNIALKQGINTKINQFEQDMEQIKLGFEAERNELLAVSLSIFLPR